MLVLSRRVGEKIVIGDGIVVTVVEVHRDSVRLGVDAPRSVPVNRAELLQAVSEENVAAMSDTDAAAALTSLKGIRPKGSSPLDLKKLMQVSSVANHPQSASGEDTKAPVAAEEKPTNAPETKKPAIPSPKDLAPKASNPNPAGAKPTPKPHPPVSQ